MNHQQITIPDNHKILIVSDLHLGGNGGKIHKVMPLLDEYDYVIFNGDIFELYSDSWKKLQKKWKVKPLLNWMKENDKKFTFIVGNHDQDLWKEETFFQKFQSVEVIQSNRKVYILHGHQFHMPEGKFSWKKYEPISEAMKRKKKWEKIGNLFFRPNLQHWAIRKGFPFIQKEIKERVDETLPKIRFNAINWAKANNHAQLIHGHSHFPYIQKDNATTVIDQGSFMIGVSYVTIERGRAKLHEVE